MRKELAGRDISIPVTPDIDRAAVTRALTGATAGQRGGINIATDVDAGQLRRQTRTAVTAVQATRPTVTVHTDVDRDSLRKSLLGLSGAGKTAGSSFLDGFAGVLKPSVVSLLIGGALVLAAPLVAGASLLGSSLAGIVVGAFALRANPQLREAVTSLLGDIDKGLTKAAQPLVKPFLEAIGILRQTAKDLAPDLRELFAAVAPYIPQLAEGVSGFMKAFTPGLVKAVKDSAPVIEKLSWALPDLGAALGDFLTTMAKVAPTAGAFIGMAVRGLADLIRLAGQFIGALTTLFGKVAEFFPKVRQFMFEVVEGWKIIFRVLGGDMDLLKLMIGNAIRDIREWWSQLWGKDLPQAVAGGTSSLVQTARGIPARITSALGNTKTMLWQAGRNMIQGLINGITSKFSGAGSLSSVMSQAASMARSFWPFSPAKQGPLSGHGSLWYAGQNLVTDLTGGMSSRLPQIASASSQLAGAVGARGVGGASTAAGGVVQIGSDGSRMGDLLIEVLREAIRYKGGNVQVVLGATHG